MEDAGGSRLRLGDELQAERMGGCGEGWDLAGLGGVGMGRAWLGSSTHAWWAQGHRRVLSASSVMKLTNMKIGDKIKPMEENSFENGPMVLEG